MRESRDICSMRPPILKTFTLTVMGLAVVCGFVSHAYALTERGSIGDLSFTVYAPDWTWQKQNINILIVLENDGSESADVNLDLVFPPGKEDHFQYVENGEPKATRIETVIHTGETVRRAYTNIHALAGVPRQTYDFEIMLSAGSRSARVPYPVRTIRGSMVSPGRWALFAPGAVALAWCIVFAVVMARLAPTGAWRYPGTPMTEPEKTDSWIDLEPTE